MKIDILRPLYAPNGVDHLKDENGAVITLKMIVEGLMLTPNKDDKEKDKFEKWEIFKKVRDAHGIIDLKVEEVTLIKKTIGIFSPPLILGQCFDIIESNN